MVRGDAWDARYIGQYVQYWGWVSAGNAWDRQGFAPGSDACGENGVLIIGLLALILI